MGTGGPLVMWAALASPTVVVTWPLVVNGLTTKAVDVASLGLLLGLLFVAPFVLGWAWGRVLRSATHRKSLAAAGLYPEGTTSLWFDHMNSLGKASWTRFRDGDTEYMGAVVRVGARHGEMMVEEVRPIGGEHEGADMEGWIAILDGDGKVAWLYEEQPPVKRKRRAVQPAAVST